MKFHKYCSYAQNCFHGASLKFRSITAHGESVSNGKKSLAGGSRAQFGDFYSVRVIERKNRTDRSADSFPSAFVTQNISFKKSYELPVTMEQENAGWSDLTESNGALDFTSVAYATFTRAQGAPCSFDYLHAIHLVSKSP